MKHILDRDFKYVPAAATDIRKTFERVKAEQEAAKAKEQEKRMEKIIRLGGHRGR